MGARAHGKYALCNIPTNTHSWQSPASAYKNFICGKYKEAPCTKLSTLAENNFNNRGDTTLNSGSTYTYKLSCGYTVKLSGWTHTRNYAKGFLRNQPGSGKAVVEGLKAGATYNYKIYQYASSYAGTNSYTVNGKSRAAPHRRPPMQPLQAALQWPMPLGRSRSCSIGKHITCTFLALRWLKHNNGIGERQVLCIP